VKASRTLRILLAAVAVGAACARPAGPAVPAASDPEVTTIGLEDAGGTISLQVGDRVVLSLDPIEGQPWLVTQYPEDILAPETTDGPAVGRAFTARAAGEGEIVAFNRAGCDPTQLRYPCPAGGPGKPPGTTFTVTVVVTR
jgi:hypothetical protein